MFPSFLKVDPTPVLDNPNEAFPTDIFPLLRSLAPFVPYNPAELSPKAIVPLFSPSIPAVNPDGVVPVYCPFNAAPTTLDPVPVIFDAVSIRIAVFVPLTKLPFAPKFAVPL